MPLNGITTFMIVFEINEKLKTLLLDAVCCSNLKTC